MKKWILTVTTIGSLLSLSAPVYAATLSTHGGGTAQASSPAVTSSTHVVASPAYGFLPPE